MAGARPNSTPVHNAIAPQKPKTRQSSPLSSTADAAPRPPDGQETRSPLRQHQASRGADDCNQQALGAQLAHESSAGGAERQARRDLLLPGRAARKQQGRDVDARDDQHERRTAHQDEQGLRIAPARVHQALAAGLGAQRRRIVERPAGVVARGVGSAGAAPAAIPRASPAASRASGRRRPVHGARPGRRRPIMFTHRNAGRVRSDRSPPSSGSDGERQREVGRLRHVQRAGKPFRRDADDGEGHLVDEDGLADDVRIAIEASVPVPGT